MEVYVAFVKIIGDHLDFPGTIYFIIKQCMVEVIIRNILFNPDDIEGVSNACQGSLCKLIEPYTVENVDEDVRESSALISQE